MKMKMRIMSSLAAISSILAAVVPFKAYSRLPDGNNFRPDQNAGRLAFKNWAHAKACLVGQDYVFKTEQELEDYLVQCIAEKIREEKMKTAIVFIEPR